jgi:hypothetical protein
LNTTEQIQRITDKVRDLLSLQEELRDENQQLKADLENVTKNADLLREELALLITERQELRTELQRQLPLEQALKLQITELEDQIARLQSSPGKMDEETRKTFEKQLNHYIKEIDRCIALLSQS